MFKNIYVFSKIWHSTSTYLQIQHHLNILEIYFWIISQRFTSTNKWALNSMTQFLPCEKSSSSFAENLLLGVCDISKLKIDICRFLTWWPLNLPWIPLPCDPSPLFTRHSNTSKNTDLTLTFHIWIDTRIFFCLHADKNIHFSLEFWQPRMYFIGRPLLKHGHLWKNQMLCAYNTKAPTC